jgi:M6 family metalloprotease-like protein
MHRSVIILLVVLAYPMPSLAASFICASVTEAHSNIHEPVVAAKPTQSSPVETRNAVLIFATFKGETPTDGAVPEWSAGIFDPDRPGSFTHFYDEMSQRRHAVYGEVILRWYESDRERSSYLSDSSTEPGLFGEFSAEILRKADADIDFARFDNDGPDGVPNSGDDDGIADVVFIAMTTAPDNFLLGPATGIASLGFPENFGLEGSFETDDTGADGSAIAVSHRQGAIQSGATYPFLVGSMAHEYGHVLGLPDLFNTQFLQSREPLGPEHDSAGIGRWGLMGHGALGWNGDDGPNSFSAWSRMSLGWAEVSEQSEAIQTVRMEPVATEAAVYRVPVTGIEFFLLEHRTRHSFYDRNIPSIGLLIWHVFRESVVLDGFTSRPTVVDLECADGRWMDAGYPLGSDPNPNDGGDNLDFWAHDDDYSLAHGGNLGDATDPFDGERYVAFTPHTNPASFDALGNRSIEVSGIQVDEDQLALTVEALPLLLSIADLRLSDENRDGIIMAGEEVELLFRVRNDGGIVARGVTVVVSSPDSLVDVVRGETDAVDLDIDTAAQTSDGGDLAVRLRETFTGTHIASLSLEIYQGEELVSVEELTLTGVSARQLAETTLIDSTSNGDGLAQVGEFVRLGIVIRTSEPEALERMSATLHPLHPDVAVVGSPSFTFQREANTASARSAEFLIGSALAPGDIVGFELTLDSGFSTWRDTVYVEVAEGGDETAPRASGLRIKRDNQGLTFSMSQEDILEGSQIQSVTAAAYSLRDTAEVVRIPLHSADNRFDGVWSDITVGWYLVRAEVEDEFGNFGVGPYQDLNLTMVGLQIERSGDALVFSIAEADLLQAGRVTAVVYSWPDTTEIARVPLSLTAERYQGQWSGRGAGVVLVRTEVEDDSGSLDVGPFQLLNPDKAVPGQSSIPGISAWQMIGPPGDDWVSESLSVAFAPSSPGVVYTTTRTALWRSFDGGSSWSRTGLMLDGRRLGRVSRLSVLVDAVEPFTVYTTVDRLRSTDGGLTWEPISIPGSGADAELIAADPVRPGRLYARRDRKLWLSDDFGDSWRDSGLRDEWVSVFVHPLAPHRIYTLSAEHLLYRSSDGGVTWDASRSEPPVRYWSMVADTRCPTCLIATGWQDSQETYLWKSTDSGDSWVRIGPVNEFGYIVRMPRTNSSLLYRFANSVMHRSEDAGRSWERTADLARVFDFAIDPHNPDHTIALPQTRSSILQSRDGTRTWTKVALEHGAGSPVRALHFDTDGRLYAGVPGSGGGGGGSIVYISSDGGVVWESRQAHSSAGLPNETMHMSLVTDPHATGTVLFISGLGDLRWSQDHGQTWKTPARAGPIFTRGEFGPPLIAHPTRAGLFYTAKSGVIRRSEDHGLTWEDRPFPETGSLVGLALATGEEETLFAAMGNRIHRSVDEGSSWTLAGEVGESDLQTLAVQPGSGRLWAVAADGIYSSSDRAEGWQRVHEADRNWLFYEFNVFGEDPRPSPIRVRFDPHDSDRLFVVTPRELLETRDGGKTWHSTGRTIAGYPWFSDVAISPVDPEALFVATSWGIYRLDGRATAVALESPTVPSEFSLDQNSPNPFNSKYDDQLLGTGQGSRRTHDLQSCWSKSANSSEHGPCTRETHGQLGRPG